MLAASEERFRGASIDLAESLRLEPGILLFPTEREVRQEALVESERPLGDLLDEALARQPELRARDLDSEAAEREETSLWWKAVGPEVYGAVEESAIRRSFDVNNRTIYGGFIGWTLAASSFADTQIAAARARQAGLDRDQVEQAIQAEVARARDAVMTARQRMAAARRGVAAAEQSLALSEDRIKGGVGLQLEALESQEALAAARIALADSIVGYNVSQVRLLPALGGVSLAALGAAE